MIWRASYCRTIRVQKELIAYIKTTDTCQLNCDHCYTNGSNGKKINFNAPKAINFFHRLHKVNPIVESGHFSLHGGEPLVCPTDTIFEFYEGVKHLWPNMWWSMQTNLTYKLTEDKVKVMTDICAKSFGTSWDLNIRWTNPKQENLWRDNVKSLVHEGHDLTVIVSLTKNLINSIEPIELLTMMIDLGIKHINFERVTANGNATTNTNGLIPTNLELDQWLYKMWLQSKQHKTWESIDNLFLDSILSSLVYNTHSGCRSRACEKKILTLNADGSIGGCPNSAVDNTFGTINDDPLSVLYSEGRMCNISTEATRHSVCNSCEVFDVCNGDCHQLGWQDDICAAPKSLMIAAKREAQLSKELHFKMLGGFMGQE